MSDNQTTEVQPLLYKHHDGSGFMLHPNGRFETFEAPGTWFWWGDLLDRRRVKRERNREQSKTRKANRNAR